MPYNRMHMRRVLCSMAVYLLLSGSSAPASTQTSSAAQQFAHGYARWSAGRHAEAKEFFVQALAPDSPLADYALYFLSRIAIQEREWETARQLLAGLQSRYPQSVWFPHAEIQRAKIAIGERDYPQAVDILRSLRERKELPEQIAEESLFLEAQAHEARGDLAQAFSLYLEVRNRAPQSPWAALARKETGRLRGEFPVLFGLNTQAAIAEEADRLARERQDSDAALLYRRLLEQEIAPSFRLRILTRLVDLYLSARKRSEAMPLLEEIARDYPEGPEAPRALYRIAQILWNRNDNQRALEYFNQLTERYPGAADADRALLAAASIYESQGKKAEAVALYNTIQARFPKSPARDAAAWRLAWLYYIGGDFKKASAVFKSLAGRAKDDSLRTASFYWHGRSAERLGAVESAKQSYHKILQAGDESYYHGLAARRLARLGIAVPAAKNGKSGSGSLDEAPAIPADIGFHLARARELTALNLDSLALVELDRASRLAGSEPALLRMLVREYAKTRSYARSLALANQLPQGLEERERHRFPLAYWDMIEEKARAHGLDPYLLLALIRQESLFDTRARSSASALGLMQLIPSTAARVAKQIGWSPPTTEGLFEPEINITLGAQYLKDLLERYGNDWHKAIAAYNAGEQAVDRWQKEIDSDDSEEFIERIPYLETRQYVKLVLRNHRIYKRLYERQ